MLQEGSLGGHLELIAATRVFKMAIRVFTPQKWYEPAVVLDNPMKNKTYD
jgi:hypothetical protein